MKLSNYKHYLKNPYLYLHLMRIFLRKIKNTIFSNKLKIEQASIESRLIAKNWCMKNEITIEAALQEIDIEYNKNYFENKFKTILHDSEKAVSECPFKLGGAGNLSLIYQILESIDAKNVIETGVAYGWSSLAILCFFDNRSKCHLWSIDKPYVGVDNTNWVGCAVPESLKKNWSLLRMADTEGIPKAIKLSEHIDFIHYDSDKSIEGRMFAYPLLWAHLRKGGILVSDDIGDNEGFKFFCEEAHLEPLIIKDGNKYQGIIKKCN